MLIYILVTHEKGTFHAHALEFDLVAVGDSLGASINAIEEQIRLYLETCSDLGLSLAEAERRAPDKFFAEFSDTFCTPDSRVFMGTLNLSEYLDGPREQAAAIL